ncbi:hypothetical protein DQ04_06781010 [Trypanosoma grayi]|uniref:hypothetical protein n=1 Tax=Trypanosoma grayi TaxID=71804 RepID=UPI0004F46BC1|nr:hypothetical protein DQ04_06781010 [Trypanosoma grayi]KEG08626.1 hypothetical protein DQ04_06781010 [Trypanosoma grayi]
MMQVVEYAESLEVSTLDHKRRRIAEEDAVIQSLQSKLKRLREKCDARVSGGSSAILEHTLLQWAKRRLRAIERKQWLHVSGLSVVSESSRLVCDSVVTIIRNSDIARDWKMVQRTISSNSFVDTLCHLDNRPIGEDLYKSILDRYVAHPLFSFESCTRESRAVGALQKWVTAYLDYQRAQFFSTDNAEMKQQIDACVNGIRKAQMRRQELKSDVQLILSGRLLRRTETVQNISSSCLQVIEGIFSDKQVSLARPKRNGDVLSCGDDNSDTTPSQRWNVSHSQLISLDGTLTSDPDEEVAALSRRCEQLQRELKECKIENNLLQEEVGKLNVQTAIIKKGRFEFEHLEAKVASLQEEKTRLLQEVSDANRNGKSVGAQRYEQKLKDEQMLMDVLHLFKNLEGEHQLLIGDYEALSTLHAKVTECMQAQTKELEEARGEVDILRKYLSMARREMLLAKSVVFLLRQGSDGSIGRSEGQPKNDSEC